MNWEERTAGKPWLEFKINKFKIKKRDRDKVYKGSSRKTSHMRSHLNRLLLKEEASN